MLMMVAGMKKGDILRGPPASRLACSRSIISNPPMPEPMKTPTRSAISGVISRPDWARASCVAAKAKWMKRPILRASFLSTKLSGSKFLTSQANVTGYPVVSKPLMGAAPLAPATSCCHTSGAVLPTPHTSPRPVMTTLRFTGLLAFRGLFVLLDVIDGVLDGLDLFGVFVGNLQIEGLFELHHQFHHV